MKKSDIRHLYYAYRFYELGGKGTLFQAYKSCSDAKIRAWTGIVAEANVRNEVQVDATPVLVISRTCEFYSCGYVSERVDPVNGNIVKWFVYHTAYRKLEIPVPELLKYEYSLAGNN